MVIVLCVVHTDGVTTVEATEYKGFTVLCYAQGLPIMSMVVAGELIYCVMVVRHFSKSVVKYRSSPLLITPMAYPHSDY